MAQVTICTESGKQIDRIEYVFIENGKQKRGRPAHSPKAFRARIAEARKDSKGRFNPSKGKHTYVAQVKIFVDGERSFERISDPR